MLPGPDRILECPACFAPVAHETLLSGNSFGAAFYTDGYMHAPMLPRVRAIVRCPLCSAAFVRRNAKVLGDAPSRPGPNQQWKDTQQVTRAEVSDYATILSSASFEPDLEIALRVDRWQLSNHNRRGLPLSDPGPPMDSGEVASLERLASLLDANDPEARVMLAEIRRELGQFEQALDLLSGEPPDGFEVTVERIRSLARQKLRRVAGIYE
jgi:hypothetical protein